MEELFAKGKRSNVYLINFNNKKAVVKKAKPGSEAIGAISDEVSWLKRLNKHKIGPKLLSCNEDSVTMEFVQGKRILEWLPAASKKEAIKMLTKILGQCRLLDKLKISKEEMQNPYKHILISKKPVMIDFERCHYTERPQNVTQFCQFLTSLKVSQMLKEKGINSNKAIDILKEYKKEYSDKSYKRLIKAMLKG